MKCYKIIPALLTIFFNVCGDYPYSNLLEAPYPPSPLALQEEEFISDKPILTIDDLADDEIGCRGSLQRDTLEYHRRLIGGVGSTGEFYSLNEVGGYLIQGSVGEQILPRVKDKIRLVFDLSMRAIYYAGYGWETLEEALYEHERLQTTVSKYYPEGIPLNSSRLSAYSRAMAFGYRENYSDKIDKIREERLTVLDVAVKDDTEFLNIGINPVRMVLDKETQKPIALWKAGSDKSYGSFILMGMRADEKLYKLESAKIEMGYVALWNELIAQNLNYLAKGRFLVPAVARFGKTTLHAYHENESQYSKHLNQFKCPELPAADETCCAESLDAFIDSFETPHVQRWGMLQFLTAASDAHRGNSLVDGRHLIPIDFGRTLGPFQSLRHFVFRTCALDWPQMNCKFSDEDLVFFSSDFSYEFAQFFEGFEKFEE